MTAPLQKTPSTCHHGVAINEMTACRYCQWEQDHLEEPRQTHDAASEKQPSPTSFTAGPWKFHRPHPDPIISASYGEITGVAHVVFGEHSSLPIACIYCCETGGIQEMNAKLLTASANSYMANAVDPVAAAEEDLLSEALTALRGMVEHHTPGHWISLTHEKHPHLLDAMAVLAKAKPLP